MWLCLNDAFVSVVQDRTRRDHVCVRARRRKHLRRLFPDESIILTPAADYACRVFVSKPALSDLLSQRIQAIDYPNFKDSVRDEGLHDLYADFWVSHWVYQQQGSD